MRLKRKRLIRQLFNRNRSDVHSVVAGGVRILYRVVAGNKVGVDIPIKVGFAVGRRTGNAVSRNRLKRIMREVYRAHQEGLIDLFSRRDDVLTIMIVVRGDPNEARKRMARDLPVALARLTERLRAPSHP